jgi:hypothetical protein
MFTGMIMKIIYSFLWQEGLVPLPFLYHPLGNKLGAWMLPAFNWSSSFISQIP